jgi:hypothetical protein
MVRQIYPCPPNHHSCTEIAACGCQNPLQGSYVAALIVLVNVRCGPKDTLNLNASGVVDDDAEQSSAAAVQLL